MAKRKQLASRLVEARIKKSLSQEALAKKAGVDRKTVNRIENGHFSPSMDTFFRLCNAMSLNPSKIIIAKRSRKKAVARNK